MPLTDALCRNATAKPGQRIRKLSEQGLQLCIYPNGSKLWRIAYRFQGKEQTLSLGPYPMISLGDARLEREKLKKGLKAGENPVAEKRAQKEAELAKEPFQVWAHRYLARLVRERRATATIKKQTWLISMALPKLGKSPISDISAPQVLDVVRKVEVRGTLDTAVRLRSAISAVFQDAIAAGGATMDPSATLGRLIAKPKRKNHPGITDPHKLGELLRAIDGYGGQPTTTAALKIAALLFPRPVEIRRAEWAEFDLGSAIWKIPAKRMKMCRDHLVPLPGQAVNILQDLHNMTGQGKYVFPSVRCTTKPISENTLNAALRALGFSKQEHTAHGFRTTASTLLNGSGYWHPDAIERQLAHEDRNSVRKAYDHQSHWSQRVRLMQWWANFLECLKFGNPAPHLPNTNITDHGASILNALSGLR